MTLTGELFIGSRRLGRPTGFRAFDPAANQPIEPEFSVAGLDDVDAACALAMQAFPVYRETSPDLRARFLETIADNIEALGDALIERTSLETGLPAARLQGERGRTCGQLRLFAQVVRAGDWTGARLDTALPERQPLPRPDLRLRKIALGPVAVFGASNFPLAFSVAGGDTASALAAGCPVVVKAHPAHPGASGMGAASIVDAVESCGLPEGVFSLLAGDSHELGGGLVADPRIKAVGFTGSRAGGMALLSIAARRPEPIPVFAEMSAVNPVLLLPAALDARADSLAQAFAGSVCMGAGQFCTNPGLVLALQSPSLDRFIATAAEALDATPPGVMLTPGIHANYVRGVETLGGVQGVEQVVPGGAADAPNHGRSALFVVSAETFMADPRLREEIFGAASVVVRCRDEAELLRLIEDLEGQLTATLHLEPADHDLARRLLPHLETKAGRILANAWPTGVEVSQTMVHGGPFPATSDPRFTSVGTLAIDRFLRPVCYQALPADLLPAALADDNPLKINRLVDGVLRPAG
ncbi:MAG: aldehyde dehydrogenase (NADP(+)) [Brevundimonas sp.]